MYFIFRVQTQANTSKILPIIIAHTSFYKLKDCPVKKKYNRLDVSLTSSKIIKHTYTKFDNKLQQQVSSMLV